MGGPGRPQNLIPLEPGTDRTREIARMGQRAQTEKRRSKAAAKKVLSLLTKDGPPADLDSIQSIADALNANLTVAECLALQLVVMAMDEESTKLERLRATKLLVEMEGQEGQTEPEEKALDYDTLERARELRSLFKDEAALVLAGPLIDELAEIEARIKGLRGKPFVGEDGRTTAYGRIYKDLTAKHADIVRMLLRQLRRDGDGEDESPLRKYLESLDGGE